MKNSKSQQIKNLKIQISVLQRMYKESGTENNKIQKDLKNELKSVKNELKSANEKTNILSSKKVINKPITIQETPVPAPRKMTLIDDAID